MTVNVKSLEISDPKRGLLRNFLLAWRNLALDLRKNGEKLVDFSVETSKMADVLIISGAKFNKRQLAESHELRATVFLAQTIYAAFPGSIEKRLLSGKVPDDLPSDIVIKDFAEVLLPVVSRIVAEAKGKADLNFLDSVRPKDIDFVIQERRAALGLE